MAGAGDILVGVGSAREAIDLTAQSFTRKLSKNKSRIAIAAQAARSKCLDQRVSGRTDEVLQPFDGFPFC